ncbi:conserved hypothetical protein [Culex quinquefasciatus]|uniref:Apple domain-containing protein n=1 Tax=Culex quinquefasciatus TaxID=7176 RepID=B0WCW5_CULQU|nr:conserved hypothetical protein [Culex quinquefasciatus]|eukprot:XP_001846549.1 conserved hypothetical protein [Culex quinquefasciatus]
MLPRSLHSTLLACLLLASALSIEGAKRRSRLDLPISKPAEAPLEDNLATHRAARIPRTTGPNHRPQLWRRRAPAAAPSSTSGHGQQFRSELENSSQMIDEYTTRLRSDLWRSSWFRYPGLSLSYVFSAPNKLLDSIPGTLMLTDCLEACQSNDSCSSVNYETGLCVLFSSNSDKLPVRISIS